MISPAVLLDPAWLASFSSTSVDLKTDDGFMYRVNDPAVLGQFGVDLQSTADLASCDDVLSSIITSSLPGPTWLPQSSHLFFALDSF